MRVLLAEDNALNQRVVQLMLAKLGQDIDIVDNGYDAVLAALGKKYDVVLMDVQMPQMDGLEATRRIRALPIVQPNIVALTASSQPEEQQACRDAGMDDYLSKPVRAEQLQAVLGNRREVSDCADCPVTWSMHALSTSARPPWLPDRP